MFSRKVITKHSLENLANATKGIDIPIIIFDKVKGVADEILDKSGDILLTGASMLENAKGKFDLVKGTAHKLFGDSNPILLQTMEIASKICNIAPIFSVMQIIISIETKARDADAKCTDLLERINFMVGHLDALSDGADLISTVEQVVKRMENCLEGAAALIKAYRKQKPLTRRLNTGNKDKFIGCCSTIESVSKDLMFSLQIQQTTQLTVITRKIASDAEDEAAERFCRENGGFDAIKNNQGLVEMFAMEIKVTVDPDSMRELNENLTEIIQKNNEELKDMLQDGMSTAIADGLKSLAASLTALEKEEVFTCVQCKMDYRESVNAIGSCAIHLGYNQRSEKYSCCGTLQPCIRKSHRKSHYNDYRYSEFYERLNPMNGYTNTVDIWTDKEVVDFEDNKMNQHFKVGQVLRWNRTADYAITDLVMFLKVGNITESVQTGIFWTPNVEDLRNIQAEITLDPQKSVLFFYEQVPGTCYVKAEWIIDANGNLNAIKFSARTPTSIDEVCHVVSFDLEKMSLKKLDIVKGGFEPCRPASEYELPKTVNIGSLVSKEPCRVQRKFKTSNVADFPIVILPDPEIPILCNVDRNISECDYFHCKFAIFNNHSTDPITISGINSMYRLTGNKSYIILHDAVALNKSIPFPITIEPKKSTTVILVVKIMRDPLDNDKDYTPAFRQSYIARHRPLRLKLVFESIEGDEASHVFDYVFCPYPLSSRYEGHTYFRIDDNNNNQTFEEKVKTLEWDGCYTDVVSFDNQGRFRQDELDKMVYRAIKSGETEVEVVSNKDVRKGLVSLSLWALVDLSCQRVYAFKLLMTQGIKFPEKTKAVMAYIRVPGYGDNLTTRPIQYANEKVQFPILSPEKNVEHVIDDEVDDVVLKQSHRLASTPGAAVGGGGINVDMSGVESRLARMEKFMEMSAISQAKTARETARLADTFEKLLGLMKNFVVEEISYPSK